MEAVLAKPSQLGKSAPTAPGRIDGVVIGTLAGIDPQGGPIVNYAGAPSPDGLSALSTCPVSDEDIGRRIALSFVEHDPHRPLVLGLVHEADLVNAVSEGVDVEASLDGQRLTLTAEREIVLHCGKSSITLTRAGKIIIRGEYVSSHSSGVNRIKGGSIQLN